MREILYTLPAGPIENSYREGAELVLLRKAALPDACVSCGQPARGNVLRKEFRNLPRLWLFLPTGLDLLAAVGQFLFGKNFVFDFPFCPKCWPSEFRLTERRIESDLAIFKGASEAFLNMLPQAPADLVAEMHRGWTRRKFPWLYPEQP